MTQSSPDQERTIVLISSLGHAICHMGELMFAGVLLAVIAEFDLGVRTTTALGVLGYILLGAGAIPMGAWADAWGPARVLHVYFVLMAVASIGVAASTEPWHLFVSLTALGLAASIYHPAGLTMISLGVKRRGRAMGINGVAGSIGQALGPTLGLLAAWYGNWRLAYLVLAGLSLAAAAVMVPTRRRLILPQHSVSGASSNVPVAIARPGLLLPLSLLLAATVLGGFNYRCLATALPGYFSGPVLQGETHSPLKGGPEVFGVLLLGGIIGQLLGGWAADRFKDRCYPLFISLLAPTAVLLAWIEGSPVAAGAAGVFALLMFAQQPIENLLLAEWSDRRRFSRSYGTKFALTFGVGALGTLATGAVWEATGSPGTIFYFVAGSASLMLLLFFTALRFVPADGIREAVPHELTPAAVRAQETSASASSRTSGGTSQ